MKNWFCCLMQTVRLISIYYTGATKVWPRFMEWRWVQKWAEISSWRYKKPSKYFTNTWCFQVCSNGVACHSVEVFCKLLKRFSYPCRYQDMMYTFAQPVPQLCMISNAVLDFLFNNRGHFLRMFLEHFANTVYYKGVPLDNC